MHKLLINRWKWSNASGPTQLILNALSEAGLGYEVLHTGHIATFYPNGLQVSFIQITGCDSGNVHVCAKRPFFIFEDTRAAIEQAMMQVNDNLPTDQVFWLDKKHGLISFLTPVFLIKHDFAGSLILNLRDASRVCFNACLLFERFVFGEDISSKQLATDLHEIYENRFKQKFPRKLFFASEFMGPAVLQMVHADTLLGTFAPSRKSWRKLKRLRRTRVILRFTMRKSRKKEPAEQDVGEQARQAGIGEFEKSMTRGQMNT